MATEQIFFSINIKTGQPIKSLGELKKNTKALRKELDGVKIGTKRFNELKTAITNNRQAIKGFNRDVNKTGSFTKKLGKSFKGAAASMLGMAAAGAAVVAVFKDAANTVRAFDEAVADLQKTTGLSAEKARELAKEVANIDTRTSQIALIELATAAGRLGLEGDEILAFTKSADKAFVSLGDSLEGSAEDIALQLGKITTAFGIDAQFGVGESIEKLGSALNELGANSKAQEGFILDFTARLQGVSSQAGISVSNLTALGALFDETGQSVEVAATTFNKLLPALGKDTQKFADVAGVSLKEFETILREDAFEALKLVAQGAKSSDTGLAAVTETLKDYGINSARSASIVTTLSNNIDRLNELQGISNTAFEEGTSLQDEFEIKNNTLNASLEKLSKSYDNFIVSIEDGSGPISRGIKGITDLFGSSFDLDNTLKELPKKIRDVGDSVKTTAQEIKNMGIAELNEEFRLNQLAVINATKKYGENSKVVQFLESKNDLLKRTYAALIKEQIAAAKASEDLAKAQTEETVSAVLSEEAKKRQAEALKKFNKELAEQLKLIRETEAAKRETQAADEAPGAFGDSLPDLDGEDVIDPATIEDESNDFLKEQSDKVIDAKIEENERKKQWDLDYIDWKKDQDLALFEAESDLNFARIGLASQLAGAVLAFAEEGSDAAKAAFAIQKGLALAEVALNLQRELALINANPVVNADVTQATRIGLITAAIARGVGIVASIASAKFNDGGILEGKSHAQGGIPFSVGGRPGFEAEGGEAVINKRSTAMFAPLLSSINQAGGGASFQTGGIPQAIPSGNGNDDVLGALSGINFSPTVSVEEINKVNTRLSEINTRGEL